MDLQIDRPHAARVYDVLLGGKTNYKADREAAQQVLENLPIARTTARENRAFMHRAVRHLAEAGVRQFLDIGTGIPTPPNLHDVAQEIAPESRVVYTDNDPIVLVHSRALHTSHPSGRTAYIDGDLCEPDRIIEHPRLLATLDLTRPVALTLLTVLHWLRADADPYAIVSRLLDALPSGSHLVISHVTADLDPPALGSVTSDLGKRGSNVTPRSKEQVAAFFDGLELLEPGLTLIEQWRPTVPVEPPATADQVVPLYVGLARKP
ncbi:MAG TPA: SAM-dependent methyltransferase [Actinoallomurus sp.]